MDDKLTVDHLAGIVPIANNKSYFNMPWHDSMMPVAEDLLAIENAVFTCALAGCDSIWIVSHMDMQPIIRKRVGEMIIDPLTHYSSDDFQYTRHDRLDRRREIQIYYVPIHPKDRDRKDSLGYSVLYGAQTSIKISRSITRWITPKKMFCCFPYGIVPYEIIYNNRKSFRSKKSSIITWNNKTIKNNIMLPFSFSRKDLNSCEERVREYSISIWEKRDNKPLRTLKFSLEEIFSALDFSEANMVESPWFYEIDGWEKYKDFLNSKESSEIKKYDDLFLPTKRLDLNFGDGNE